MNGPPERFAPQDEPPPGARPQERECLQARPGSVAVSPGQRRSGLAALSSRGPTHRELTRPGGQTRIRNGLSLAGCPRPQMGAETITLPALDCIAGFVGTLKDPG